MSDLTYVKLRRRMLYGGVAYMLAALSACATQPHDTVSSKTINRAPSTSVEQVILVDPMPTTRPATDLRSAVDSSQSLGEKLSNLWDVYCPARQALYDLAPYPEWGVGDGHDGAELIQRDQELQAIAVYLVRAIDKAQGKDIPTRKEFSVMERKECLARQE